VELADAMRYLFPASQPLSAALAEYLPPSWPWGEHDGDEVRVSVCVSVCRRGVSLCVCV
jgi:hypothetical protein